MLTVHSNTKSEKNYKLKSRNFFPCSLIVFLEKRTQTKLLKSPLSDDGVVSLLQPHKHFTTIQKLTQPTVLRHLFANQLMLRFSFVNSKTGYFSKKKSTYKLEKSRNKTLTEALKIFKYFC